jgi:hypothetical protein
VGQSPQKKGDEKEACGGKLADCFTAAGAQLVPDHGKQEAKEEKKWGGGCWTAHCGLHLF